MAKITRRKFITDAEKGSFELTSAFNYTGQSGYTPEGKMNFPHVNQQAKQMDDFALAIKKQSCYSCSRRNGKKGCTYH